MGWTDEQNRAIHQREGSLLVSAAAGSGKTAVLTNRVVEYAASGGSLDRLLVVTFTRLAASEMRERIGKLLSTADFKDKESLRRQKLLLYKAKISTIDSFFGEIVRDNFKTLGISPDFRMLDDAEYGFIKSDVLSSILDECYKNYPDGFSELLRLFGGEGENEEMTKQINALYVFLQSLPFPEEWTKKQKDMYTEPGKWLSDACADVLPDFAEYLRIYDEILDDNPFSEKETVIIEEERDFIRDIIYHLEKSDWDSAQKTISAFTFKKSPPCQPHDRTKQKYKVFRNMLKAYIAKPLFSMDGDILRSDLEEVKTGVFSLIDITLEYIAGVNAEMKRRNAYSFDAIARFALELTVRVNEKGEKEITEYAKTLSRSFDEILIDEYQDVNDLQECFFTSISQNNCFAVGDIKQSIYMFRQANPDNFAKKLESLPVIYLNRNFRSRKGILDFCNFIFSRLFSERTGGMEYGASEALYPGAEYPDTNDADVELHLLADSDEEDNYETQARFCARKIKQMVKNGFTVSYPTRKADFSDFAIIIRDRKNLADYERIFFEEGVPCIGSGGGTFLDAPETATVFAFMKAIDNPYDDLSLFAAMFSPIGGFTADETGKIRIIDKNEPLYTNLTEAAKSDEHAAEFLSFFTKMRLLARNLPVHSLVREIFDQTGYPSFIQALPLGYLKKERLMSFYAFARSFSESKGGSLYEFIKFTENAAETGSVKTAEGMPSGNFVKIMTIHASKGLEFPIVILPQLNKKINYKSLREPLIIDIDAGLATKMRDKEMIFEKTTFMREVLARKKKRKELSETLRLLYVAFTRAREKLILVSGGDKYGEELFYEHSLFCSDGKVSSVKTYDSQSPEDLILDCLTCHPMCKELITEFSDVAQDDHEKTDVFINEPVPENETVSEDATDFDIPITEEEIARRCSPTKKQERIPAKISVTELIKNRLEDKESEKLIKNGDFETEEMRMPDFMLQNSELRGAQAGTAMHLFISLADLSLPAEDEIKRLVEGKFIAENQAEVIRKNSRRIAAFQKSELFAKMMSAEKIRKEEYFVVRLPAKEFSCEAEENEEILLQGAIDVLCEYADGLMIIDYKTDRATKEELVSRYKKQLEYYAYAAQKSFEKPVKEIYLWSFYLSEPIMIGGEKND
ncbi:MAG: UvrD-helicase domain-containing protein [Clostridia bacterium]|nr:UvrD-helicase domain-containing protein [Clostridia bacterium]